MNDLQYIYRIVMNLIEENFEATQGCEALEFGCLLLDGIEGSDQQINAQDHGVFVHNLLGSSNLEADLSLVVC